MVISYREIRLEMGDSKSQQPSCIAIVVEKEWMVVECNMKVVNGIGFMVFVLVSPKMKRFQRGIFEIPYMEAITNIGENIKSTIYRSILLNFHVNSLFSSFYIQYLGF